MPMASGNPQDPLVRRVLVRPPPVRATRETFLEDDALPISARNVIEGVSVPRSGSGVRAAPGGPLEPGQNGPNGQAHGHQGQKEAAAPPGGAGREAQQRTMVGE